MYGTDEGMRNAHLRDTVGEMRRSIIPALLVACVLAVPPAAPAAELPIQPGAQVSSSVGLCTLNFVFTDARERMFIGTAGHCVDTVGDRVASPAAGAFGTVVYRVMEDTDDFALIRVDRAKRQFVSAEVRAFGVPTGYTRARETSTGDLLQLHGFGMLLGDISLTRTRTGILAADDRREYFAELPAIFGDSGGPVVHVATGKALGVVSGIGVTIPPSTLLGTTVQRIMRLLDRAGFDGIRLVTT